MANLSLLVWAIVFCLLLIVTYIYVTAPCVSCGKRIVTRGLCKRCLNNGN